MSKEYIEVDLFDELRPGNRFLFNLFDDFRWDILKEKMTDPTNEKTLNEIMKEVFFSE